MDLDFLADKVFYHTSITKPTNKMDEMMKRMGYSKPAQSPRQIDMLNYYTTITQPSLAERIVAKYKN